MSPRIFLVFSGGNDRAVLAFLRFLRSRGQRAAVIARTADDLILRSSYRSWVALVRRDHSLDLGVFREGVDAARLATGASDFTIFPSTEYLNRFLIAYRCEIEQLGCEVPLVDASLYVRLSNKRSAIDFFRRAGVTVPRELEASAVRRFPVVAKPKSNISVDGESLYPKFITSRGELELLLEGEKGAEYFMQEFLEGSSVYLMFYLPRDGSSPSLWSQCNLLQQPDGKSMLLAESSEFHMGLEAAKVVSALRSAGFWGLGMVEFIISSGKAVFIEMNPRPWGPMQLCIASSPRILASFVAEATRGDVGCPLCGEEDRRTPARYGWANGLIQTLLRGGRPIWHRSERSLLWAFVACLRDDIYLRRDSWRCFLVELWRVLTGVGR